MKCKKCDEELAKEAKFCPKCGEEVASEKKEESSKAYCPNCGKKIEKNITFCPECGCNTSQGKFTNPAQRSKLGAGLLGIFLGALGVHNFYLGYTSKGLAQLLLTTLGWVACGLGPIVAGIWGLIEGIQILTGSITVDADGNRLQD